ncbi:beta-galactosidase trimerization domain-containing protein [Bacillus cereus]|uniref:beta-galactosidase trimerization domain-containing protein n=1 Tax=Bacillus cereus TaxID=1396 RepID=UPI003A8F3071
MYFGFNYHPSSVGCHYWTNWNENEIKEDLLLMSKEGYNVVRFFLFWKDFEPEEGRYNKLIVERLHRFMQLANEVNLYCIPSILTIWMNGQLFKLPWTESTDLWKDANLKKRAENFLEFIGLELRKYKNILYYDIGDEIIYINKETSLSIGETEAKQWLKEMKIALNKGDESGKIMLGTDHLSIVGNNAFHVSNIENQLDILAVHGFPLWTEFNIESNDSWKSSLYVSFLVAIASAYGQCIVDEFGLYGCSDDIRSDYLLTSGLSSILHGAIGLISWCWKDFESTEKPYDLRPGERFVGFYNLLGEPKTSVNSLKECMKVSREIKSRNKVTKKVGVFITENSEGFNCSELKSAKKSIASFYAFLLLKKTHIPVEFCKDNLSQYKAIIVPSNNQLTERDLEELKRFVKYGGTLIYSPGDYLYGHGIGDLFGIELCDFSLDRDAFSHFDYMGCSYSIDWGDDVCNQIPVIKETTADVLTRFTKSNTPAITRNMYEKGKVYYINFPMEFLLNRPYSMDSEEFYKIYKAILHEEGIVPPIEFSNPFVAVHYLYYEDYQECLLINHTPKEQNGQLIKNEKSIEIQLNPKSVKRFKIFLSEGSINESCSSE